MHYLIIGYGNDLRGEVFHCGDRDAPAPLFQKLDESIVADELARLHAKVRS